MKPVASGQLDKQETITQPPLAELQAKEERQGNRLQEYDQRFGQVSEEDQKLSRLCSKPGLRLVEDWTILLCSSVTKRKRKSIFLPRIYTMPRDQEKELVSKGGSKASVRFGPVWDIQGLQSTTEDTVLKFKFNLCFKIKPYLGLEL